jgi:SAM-dependent methyltransferase
MTPQGEFRDFERAGWDRIAQAYDDFFGPITARAIDPLLDAAGVRQGARVVDVATGPGRIAGRAAARGAAAVGVDLAPEMVGLAARLHPEAEFLAAPAEALPFPSASLDAAVCGFGLGHFAEPAQAVAEAARVLAPGGRLALAWWGDPRDSRLLGLFHEALELVGAAPPPELPPGPPFFRYSCAGALRELLEGAGLHGPEVREVAFVERLPDPGALWAGVLGSSVRTAAAIAGQPEDLQRQIRAAFDRLCAPHIIAGELVVPVVIYIAAARSKGFPKASALTPKT